MTIGAVGGAATAWTGGGAILGRIAVYHGSDVLVSGIRQMWSGETTQTLTEKGISNGLQKAGVKKEKAEVAAVYADGAISMLFSPPAFVSPQMQNGRIVSRFIPLAADDFLLFFLLVIYLIAPIPNSLKAY